MEILGTRRLGVISTTGIGGSKKTTLRHGSGSSHSWGVVDAISARAPGSRHPSNSRDAHIRSGEGNHGQGHGQEESVLLHISRGISIPVSPSKTLLRSSRQPSPTQRSRKTSDSTRMLPLAPAPAISFQLSQIINSP
ncbi:hypothetical protein L211DRAFT_95507 [Terfezia boudieri ATCC MYA-4762]|uniref:Uncharacterized protein n=1 Tax=Terfezia boudieri ATCC MYA-4762 TaxID=1051890 RepID=A0A3N4LS25_9PEZI|nr:hypothetical protein L211DRAFT_95507 [Terfezia boudieri ATCC MYA-4762]